MIKKSKTGLAKETLNFFRARIQGWLEWYEHYLDDIKEPVEKRFQKSLFNGLKQRVQQLFEIEDETDEILESDLLSFLCEIVKKRDNELDKLMEKEEPYIKKTQIEEEKGDIQKFLDWVY